ncbi:hypothetical protein DFH06DRAFT_1142278 [Mycena polygramma]|nr:hypothetical protein DFH06DRAFT_1142278 [Mycena polygramma]
MLHKNDFKHPSAAFDANGLPISRGDRPRTFDPHKVWELESPGSKVRGRSPRLIGRPLASNAAEGCLKSFLCNILRNFAICVDPNLAMQPAWIPALRRPEDEFTWNGHRLTNVNLLQFSGQVGTPADEL